MACVIAELGRRLKMKIQDKTIGIAGAVLFLFSLVYWSIQNIWNITNWITLILGLAGMGYFLYMYYTKREKGISTRSLQYGSNVLVQFISVIGIVALLAFLTSRQHYRSDWTENRLYSLADQTEKILQDLNKDVTVKAFYRDEEQGTAQDLLEEYNYRSGQFKYEFIDPVKEPHISKQYQIQQYRTVVVESGLKRETLTDLNESNLTNAIMKVTRDQDKVIYFLTGHGERSIHDEGPEGYKIAVDEIKKQNHLVREILLARNIAEGRGIPDSCSVLVIAGPKSNFIPVELDSIKAYLDKGGKSFIMLDPEHPQDLADLMNDYHVTVGNDLVVDASGIGQLLGAGPAMPLVSSYDNEITITKDFSMMTFFRYASSVTLLEDKGGYDIKSVLKTGANSWAEVDFRSGTGLSFNEDLDLPGPVTIGALVEKSIGDKKMSLAIYGDSDFAINGYFNNQGNGDLFLNTINYLAEEEDLISIRPKDYEDRRVTLTQADIKMILYLVVIAFPLLVVIAGVVFYIRSGR
jgi:ABC-type uncharacterized transport system involved in gliding motility auxiliary subunit